MKNHSFRELEFCTICPHACGVNRNAGQKGYCGCGPGYEIASICIHKGEEPAISGKNGIVNVFFSGCNLSCSYCQNYQISRRQNHVQNSWDEATVVEEIAALLKTGIRAVGFVSPSHFTPQVRAIILALHKKNLFPVTVYNTNAFDNVHELRKLEGLIDVYLPDFKYFQPELSKLHSGTSTYPEAAKSALKEMYRQKGSALIVDDDGQAVMGMIIRHLVLPGYTDDSIHILEWIAEELSVSVHISLMSQYYPTPRVQHDSQMGRPVWASEYKKVADAMEKLGFYNGWIQDLTSPVSYQPDFTKEHPFEG